MQRESEGQEFATETSIPSQTIYQTQRQSDVFSDMQEFKTSVTISTHVFKEDDLVRNKRGNQEAAETRDRRHDMASGQERPVLP